MPFDIFKVGAPGKEYCVFKVNAQNKRTGDRLGCHASRKQAALQIAAIEASERDKDMTEEIKVKSEPTEAQVISKIPGNATSFGQVEEFQTNVFTSERVGDLSRQFETLASNIMVNPEVEDKATAISELSKEYNHRVEHAIEQGREPSFLESLFRKSGLRPKEEKSESVNKTKFMLWKEGDRLRWMTIYSNKYRDQDNPPEILAERAHEDFIARVDNKEADSPELWLWHLPGTQIGEADWLSYDKDNGFAIASGLIDKDVEAIAENLAEMETLVSHGMPVESIERDEKDLTVITRYDSKEISILPDYAAANLLTDFVVIKEQAMSIPDDKLEFLKQAGLKDEQIAEINAALDQKGKDAEGLEFKETEEESKDVKLEIETPEEDETEPVGFTIEDVVEGVVAVLAPLQEKQEELAKAIEQLKESDKSKIEDVVLSTPRASFDAVLLKALGARTRSETKISKDDELAKSGPKEADPLPDYQGRVGTSILSGIIAESEKKEDEE
jgi:hypothetical protein